MATEAKWVDGKSQIAQPRPAQTIYPVWVNGGSALGVPIAAYSGSTSGGGVGKPYGPGGSHGSVGAFIPNSPYAGGM